MAEEGKEKTQQAETKGKPTPSPLVFISHDARDAEFAEAFSTLLRSTTAGMLKSFRSSDKKGTEGIEFGDEWYNQLMKQLELASDVVCLLTERSYERPWILYEAGVAKGKFNKRVFCVALGIPLSKTRTGPFYHFQNCDDDEESLTKLINQLAERIPGCEPVPNVVKVQVQEFKACVNEIMTKLGQPSEEEETPSESSTAQLFEELKLIVRELPRQVEKRLSDPRFRERRGRVRHLHPMLFHKFMRPDDPVGILIITSALRDEVPWLEVLAREVYDAMHGRSRSRKERAVRALRRALEFSLHGPMGEELFEDAEEYRMIFHELERFLDHMQEGLAQGGSEE